VTPRELAERWRADADLLRRRGAPHQADSLETCARELEETLTQFELEQLTPQDAAAETGYSAGQIRRLFPGRKRIPRRELPKKPGHGRAA
jgi:DNA-directed RNA polymerase specialized sigma24 family protein